MKKINPFWRGLLYLVLFGLVGYGLGLGLDLLVNKAVTFSGSVPSVFALFFGFTAFFLGVFGYRGVTRGLVWQVVGTLVGGFVVAGIRALMGLPAFGAFFFTEPSWVFGALVGALSFLSGVGVLDDWMKWARGIDTPEHHEEHFHGWEKYFAVSLDHKVIGIQYTVTAFLLISIGGLFALIFRSELATSQLQFSNDRYETFQPEWPSALQHDDVIAWHDHDRVDLVGHSWFH